MSITANVLHPGLVRTSFGAEDPPPPASDCSPHSFGPS
jgi:hypothetical protein